MAQHRLSRSPVGTSTNARSRWIDPEDVEITDIIPFNEFGNLGDLDFLDNTAFDADSQVLRAPELDDLHDTDNLTPLRLVVPSEFLSDPAERHRRSRAARTAPQGPERPPVWSRAGC